MEQKKSSFISPGTFGFIPSYSDSLPLIDLKTTIPCGLYGRNATVKTPRNTDIAGLQGHRDRWGRNQAINPLIKASGISLGFGRCFFSVEFTLTFLYIYHENTDPQIQATKNQW